MKAGKFKYRDHAIFMRINALTRSLESAFVKHGVPFQIVKGLAFFDRKENRTCSRTCGCSSTRRTRSASCAS